MKTPLYRDALVHAWHFTWKNKPMWIFGLFATFLGQMGILEFLSKATYEVSKSGGDVPVIHALPVLRGLSIYVSQLSLPIDGWIWLVWLIFIFIGFGLLLTVFSTISYGAIIHGVAHSIRKKDVYTDVIKAWHAGTSHFWRVLLIHIVKFAILGCLAGLIGLAARNVIDNYTVGGSLLFLLTFLVSAVVGLVVSFLVVYASGYVVVEEQSFLMSVRNSWQLFLDHWLVSIEVGGIVLLLNILFAVLVAAGVTLLLVPGILFFWLYIATAGVIGYSIVLIIGFVLSALFIAFTAALLSVFTVSVWMNLFMNMHKTGIVSRLMHALKWRS